VISVRYPRPAVRLLVASAALALLPLAGCQQSYPPDLHYGLRTDVVVFKPPKTNQPEAFDPPGGFKDLIAKIRADKESEVDDPASLPGRARRGLERDLEDLFGTPAAPRVGAAGSSEDVVNARLTLGLDEQTLQAGSQLYRRHCLHCHGLTGNGQGPTAAWVNPHPRDYRRGKFKFVSATGEKPLKEDVVRVLRQGVEGTSMPAFGALSNSRFGQLEEEDLHKLASYVVHLSIRGQVESDTIHEWARAVAQKETLDDDYPYTRLETIAKDWTDAVGKRLDPAAPPEFKDKSSREAAVRRGYEQFTTTTCIGCHKDFGRRPNYLYDAWGTVVRPADLTQGIYRGGRRPVDIYWRVHAGIPPSSMPAGFAPKTAGDAKAAAEESARLWDIVAFVKALPYPGMLPEDVKAKVYPDLARKEGDAEKTE
jgi:mono/diheme cytochrome c family protein